MNERTAITIRQTGAPSRSKQAGPCWIRVGDTYAATTDRTVEAEIGTVVEVTGKASLRRATRTTVDRAEWQVRVTGDPADTVTLSLGVPQAVVAVISGVVEI